MLPVRFLIIFAGLIAALLLLFYFIPGGIAAFLAQAGNLWGLALLAATLGTLLWFVYWVCLRRLFRIRRIARIRSKRLLDEAASRGREPPGRL